MSYRAVIFDLFDTLLYVVDTGTREMAFAALREAGVAEEDWRRGWRESFDLAVVGRTRSLRQRVLGALRTAGLANPPESLADRVSGLLSARLYPQLYDDVRPTLASVRTRGFRLGMIANIYGDEREIVSTFDLTAVFDAPVLSCDEGLAKPDPAIYRLCAQRLSVEPSECVFVDDRADYLEGARAVGMMPVQIDRPGRTHVHGGEGAFEVRIASLDELLPWLPSQAVSDSLSPIPDSRGLP